MSFDNLFGTTRRKIDKNYEDLHLILSLLDERLNQYFINTIYKPISKIKINSGISPNFYFCINLDNFEKDIFNEELQAFNENDSVKFEFSKIKFKDGNLRIYIDLFIEE